MKSSSLILILVLSLTFAANANESEDDEITCAGDIFLTDGGKACKDSDGKMVFIDDLPRDVRQRLLKENDPDYDDGLVEVSNRLSPEVQARLMDKCGRDLNCLNRETKKLNPESDFDRRKREAEEARTDTRYRSPSSSSPKADPCEKYRFQGAKDAYLQCLTSNKAI